MKNNIKKIIGFTLVATILVVLFFITASTLGVIDALYTWAASVLLGSILVGGVYLIFDK